VGGLLGQGNHLAIDLYRNPTPIVTEPLHQVGNGERFRKRARFPVQRDVKHRGIFYFDWKF
jgi:hypothetical protein